METTAGLVVVDKFRTRFFCLRFWSWEEDLISDYREIFIKECKHPGNNVWGLKSDIKFLLVCLFQ